jgi:hypothetical protein
VICQEFQQLLTKVPSIGEPLPIHVNPFPVNDSVPEEDEIYSAIQRLRLRRVPGPSGICAEDLLLWHDENPKAWLIVIELVQIAFRDGIIPFGMVRGILCLLPKDDGKFRGISLLETVHKICAAIIHLRLSSSIVFHPGIHGFIKQRGTSTAILETKLLMQLASHGNHYLF